MCRKVELLDKRMMLGVVVTQIVPQMTQFQQLHQHQMEVDSLSSGNLSSIQPALRHLIDFITVQHQVGCESIMLVKKDVLVLNGQKLVQGMNGIKSIGFSLEDGSIYSGMFDLMVGGEVQAEIVNHIQHYRESPLVQKAISDIKTLLEKRQESKELEERPSTRQSVREALKNRKKAQEQQSNQEQEKPKKAKKKGEMEL